MASIAASSSIGLVIHQPRQGKRGRAQIENKFETTVNQKSEANNDDCHGFVRAVFRFHQRASTNARTEANEVGIPLKRPDYRRTTHFTIAECESRRRVWRQQRAPRLTSTTSWSNEKRRRVRRHQIAPRLASTTSWSNEKRKRTRGECLAKTQSFIQNPRLANKASWFDPRRFWMQSSGNLTERGEEVFLRSMLEHAELIPLLRGRKALTHSNVTKMQGSSSSSGDAKPKSNSGCLLKRQQFKQAPGPSSAASLISNDHDGERIPPCPSKRARIIKYSCFVNSMSGSQYRRHERQTVPRGRQVRGPGRCLTYHFHAYLETHHGGSRTGDGTTSEVLSHPKMTRSGCRASGRAFDNSPPGRMIATQVPLVTQSQVNVEWRTFQSLKGSFYSHMR